MGSALVRALIEKNAVTAKDVIISDISEERLIELGSLGVATTRDNRNLTSKSDVVFLCVKPQLMAAVLDEIAPACSGKLVVSIAAGVSTKYVEKKLSGARVIRVMPNTPALVGELAAGFCLGKTAGRSDGELVGGLLSSLGVAVVVQEKLMDAVTGLSGSGPAYYYYIIDALARAGVRQGLSEQDALALAAKTAKGAAEMVLASGKNPKELIEMVCSPGGTTIEGMRVLEASDIRGVLEKTVAAATEKARKLSQ